MPIRGADMRNSSRHPRRRAERGTALIEFALVLPFLLVLSLLVIDFSRAFYAKNTLHQAVREGARLLAVSQLADSSSTTGRVTQVIHNAGLEPKSITVETLPGHLVRVKATADFTFIYPGLLNWLGVAFENPV